MPSRPPETLFYDDPQNYVLWRDVSRVYEDFCGDDNTKYAERTEQFVTVLNDVLTKLNDSKGQLNGRHIT